MSETCIKQRCNRKHGHLRPILTSAAMLGHTTHMNIHPPPRHGTRGLKDAGNLQFLLAGVGLGGDRLLICGKQVGVGFAGVKW